MTLYVCRSDEVGRVQGGVAIDTCAVQKDTQVFFAGLSRVHPGNMRKRWNAAQQWGFIHSFIYLSTYKLPVH